MTASVHAASASALTYASTAALSGFADPEPGAAFLAGSPTPSLAAPPGLTRAYQSSFGSFPSSSDPQALTVDQSTGDVYVVSPGAGTVSRFTSTGAAEDFSSGPDSATNTLTGFSFDGPSAAEVAIAPAGSAGGTAGDIYVASFAGVDIYSNTGTHLGQITQANGSGFEEACGVATDTAGKVYVGDFRGNVDRYVPSANPATNADYDAQITGVFSPCNVAADSTGAVYASSFPTGPLKKYAASDFGTSNQGTTVDAHSNAVAVDPSTDDVYVDEGEAVAVFNAAGESMYSFGSSSDFGTESAGVAVKGSGGDAYVADRSAHEVDVFAPAAVPPPTATTGAATEVHHLKATLNGHLDPNGDGEVTDCHFEWGPTSAYGNTAPCAQGNDFTAAADVSAAVSGLEVGHTYHFRLSVSRETTTATGADQALATPAIPVVHAALSATFGTSGTGDGQFSGNSDIAIDQATGDVYVDDTSNHRIEKFDSSGGFISAFGWGVKDGAAAAETCSSGCRAGISGSGPGQLATPAFVAVDNSAGPSSGDVYVGDTTNNTVTKFDSSGKYISTNDGTASGSAFYPPLAGIAVNANGDLWAYDTNGDMRKFAQDGTFIVKWNSNYGVTPAGIGVDSADDPYVIRGTPVIEKLAPTGSDLGQISGPEFTGATTGFAVDPISGDLFIDEDGTTIRHYLGTCEPSTGPCANVDSFGTGELTAASGVAINSSTGHVYVSDSDSVKIFDPVTPPEVNTGSASATSATTATLKGTVGPNDVALTDCHFEYVSDAAFLATGFADLSSGGSAACQPDAASIPADLEDHAVSATITGLDPRTIYHFRLLDANAQTSAKGEAALIPGAALAETTGSPTRTTTTARLDSRVDPRDAITSYHFEYGDQGPCDSNPCTSTPAHAAGKGETFELVSQQLSGLAPNTTYHYRVVADNGTPGGVAFGDDATLTTRSSDEPLTHGTLPGPRGSDRAWEQVSIPDTGGNPVSAALAISENGERAIYAIDGGSPGSQNGGGLIDPSNLQYAQRTSTGWQRGELFPTRAQAPGNLWQGVRATNDLSRVIASNVDITNTGPHQEWGMTPGALPQLFLEVPFASGKPFVVSAAEADRTLAAVEGSIDPAHPVESEMQELYELTAGTPRMVGLLPDGSVPPPCGVRSGYAGETTPSASHRWLSPDGSHAVFATYPAAETSCIGETGLFVRDLVNSTTTQIAAHAVFDRIAGGNVFFTTPESIAPNDHGGLDLYRYELAGGGTVCTTCSTPLAGSVELSNGNAFESIAVSDDGSHVYLQASHRLVQGAAELGIYRLNVSTGSVAYVAPRDFGPFGGTGNNPQSSAVSPDGSVFAFSSSNPSLDALNGQQNAGGLQIYRYNDRDRSLVCVSCPGDGSAPVGEASLAGSRGTGSSANALTTEGNLAFVTDTPLSPFDQNTARQGQEPRVGADVYEWRDGRLLLVTDGESSTGPIFEGASTDGRDIFFSQPAQLTPEAPDAQRRIYDARIGGGFVHPRPAPPCSLEDCQGIPSPSPDDPTPGSASFSGPGNQAASTPGSSTGKPKTKTAAQLRAEKLAKSLKGCRKGKKKAKRAVCERSARKKYGTVKKKSAKRTENKRRGK